jgi:hypothetical protein
MLAGKKAGEVLTRLLADPNRFLENGELEDADWHAEHETGLNQIPKTVDPALTL